jgi:hypothetical protein
MLRHLRHSLRSSGERSTPAATGWPVRWTAGSDNDMPFELPNCGSLMYLRIAEDQKFGSLIGAHLRDRGVFFSRASPPTSPQRMTSPTSTTSSRR